jgi:hypothetical protein
MDVSLALYSSCQASCNNIIMHKHLIKVCNNLKKHSQLIHKKQASFMLRLSLHWGSTYQIRSAKPFWTLLVLLMWNKPGLFSTQSPTLCQCSWHLNRDLNSGPSKYKAIMLTTYWLLWASRFHERWKISWPAARLIVSWKDCSRELALIILTAMFNGMALSGIMPPFQRTASITKLPPYNSFQMRPVADTANVQLGYIIMPESLNSLII